MMSNEGTTYRFEPFVGDERWIIAIIVIIVRIIPIILLTIPIVAFGLFKLFLLDYCYYSYCIITSQFKKKGHFGYIFQSFFKNREGKNAARGKRKRTSQQ